MARKKIIYFLTGLVLLLALFQAPFLYYFSSGLLIVVFGLPYLLVGSMLTGILFSLISKSKQQEEVRLAKIGAILALVIGLTSLFLGPLMAKLDWQIRKGTRKEIIQQVKAGRLKRDNGLMCTLSDWDFPLISNGGNEIVIHSTQKGRATVEFYTDRGFLDSYSAFLYTEDDTKLRELEKILAAGKGPYFVEKLEANWYKVAY